MTASAMLMREIETLPEESLPAALDFVSFLKNRPFEIYRQKPKPRSMFGAFPGINTNVEREDSDRI